MLYRFTNIQKVLILLFIYSTIGLIAHYIFQFGNQQKSTWVLLILNFMLCWNLMLIGFFYFQAFKFHRLPEKYYLKKWFESDRLYKIFGVAVFRLILIHSFFRHLNNRVYLKGRKKEYLNTFIEETKQSETSHILSTLATLIMQLIYLMTNQLESFLWLTVFNILFNLYPLLLQRMNRFSLIRKYPNLINS